MLYIDEAIFSLLSPVLAYLFALCECHGFRGYGPLRGARCSWGELDVMRCDVECSR